VRFLLYISFLVSNFILASCTEKNVNPIDNPIIIDPGEAQTTTNFILKKQLLSNQSDEKINILVRHCQTEILENGDTIYNNFDEICPIIEKEFHLEINNTLDVINILYYSYPQYRVIEIPFEKQESIFLVAYSNQYYLNRLSKDGKKHIYFIPDEVEIISYHDYQINHENKNRDLLHNLHENIVINKQNSLEFLYQFELNTSKREYYGTLEKNISIDGNFTSIDFVSVALPKNIEELRDFNASSIQTINFEN
jgi:hypothetical protein